MNAQVHTRETLAELLLASDTAVIRALLALYQRQTSTEQRVNDTIERNHRGFNCTDVHRMTSFVKFYQAKGYLSPRQIAWARPRLLKYTKQLLEIAAENGRLARVSK